MLIKEEKNINLEERILRLERNIKVSSRVSKWISIVLIITSLLYTTSYSVCIYQNNKIDKQNEIIENKIEDIINKFILSNEV